MYKLIITELSCKIKEFNRMIRSLKSRNTHLKKSISYRTKSTNNQDIKYILQSTSLRKNLHLFSPNNQKRFINTFAKGNFTGKILQKQPFLSPSCKCSFCTQYQKFYWNSCKFIDVNKELMLENEIAYFKKSIRYLQKRISSFFNEQIGEEEALKAIDDSVLNYSSSNKKESKSERTEDDREKKIPAQTCARRNRKVADGLKKEKKMLEERKKTRSKKYFSTRLNRIARPDLRKEKPRKFVITKYKFISTQKQIKKQPKMKPIKLQNRNETPEKSNDILTTVRIAFDLIKTIGENKIKDIKKQIKILQAKFLQRSADVTKNDELKKDNLMRMKKEDGNKDERNKDEGNDKKARQLNEKPHIEKIKNDLKSAIESNYRETFGNTFKEKSKLLKDAKKTARSKRDLKDFDEVTSKNKCLVTLKSLKQDIKKRAPKENRIYNLKNLFNFHKSKVIEKSKSSASSKSAETPDINVKTVTKSDSAIQIAQNRNLKPPDDKKSDSLTPEDTKSNLTLTSIYQEEADEQQKRLENLKPRYKCQKKGTPDDQRIILERTKSILTLNSIEQDLKTLQGKENAEHKDLIEQINEEIQSGSESKTSLIDCKVTSMKGVIDELNNEILHGLKPQTNRKAAEDATKSTKQTKINTELNLEGIREDLGKEIRNKYASNITKKLTSKPSKPPEVSSKASNEPKDGEDATSKEQSLSKKLEENEDSLEKTLDEMQRKKSSSRLTNWLVSKKIFSAEIAKNNKIDDDSTPNIGEDKLDAVRMKQDMLNDLRYEKNPAERLTNNQRSEDSIEDKLERPSITPQPNPPPKKEDDKKRKVPPEVPKNSMILPPRHAPDNPKLDSRIPDEVSKKLDEAKTAEAFKDEFKQVVHENTVLLVPKSDPKSTDKSKNILNKINIDSIEELEIEYKDGSDKNLIKIAEEMDKAKNKEKETFLPTKPPLETAEGSIKATVKSTNLVSSYQLEGVFRIYQTTSAPDNSPKRDPKKNWTNSNRLKGSLNLKDQKKTNPAKKYSDLAGNKSLDHSTRKKSDSPVEEEPAGSSLFDNSTCKAKENDAVMCSKKDDDKSSKKNSKTPKNKPESFHKEKKSDRLTPKLIQRKNSIVVKEDSPKTKKRFRPTLTVVYAKKNKKLDNYRSKEKRKEQTRRKRKSRVRKRRRNVILFMLKDELKKNEREAFKSPKKSVTPDEEIRQALSKYKFKTPTEVANDFSAVPMRDVERNRMRRRESVKKGSFYRNLDREVFAKGKGGEKGVGGKVERGRRGGEKDGKRESGGDGGGSDKAVLSGGKEDEEDDSGEPKSVLK